jgi:molybdopterin-biosynthesis enzyme MoeA-like protein
VIEDAGVQVFCVPGVPVEMKAVFKKHILPLVKKGVGSFISKEVNYFVTGVSEGMIAPALVKIVDSNPRDAVYLKTHPRGYYRKTTPRIRVHLVCKGAEGKEVAGMLARISKQILKDISRLGGKVEK